MFKKIIVILFLFISAVNSGELNRVANAKLINAAANGSLEEVQDALKEGADINIQAVASNDYSIVPDSESPLMHATKLEHLDIVKYLVLSKAYVDLQDALGRTALLFAVRCESDEIAKCLLEAGANVNLRDSFVENPLFHAIGRTYFMNSNKPYFAKVKLLTWYGADINETCSKEGDSPIELADAQYYCGKIEHQLEGEKIYNFLVKFAPKQKNLKNKSFKNIVEKVNSFLKKRIVEQEYLPKVLQNIVLNYSLYPENYEEIFNLSDQEIDELIKIYSDEFEATSKEAIEQENSISIKSKRMKLK